MSFGGKPEVMCKREQLTDLDPEKTGQPLTFIKKHLLTALSSVPSLSTQSDPLPKITSVCFIPVNPVDKGHLLQLTEVTDPFFKS